MEFNARGPGLYGFIRWECYCYKLSPDHISRADAVARLASKTGGPWDLTNIGAPLPTPCPPLQLTQIRLLAQELAVDAACEEKSRRRTPGKAQPLPVKET